MSTKQAAKWIAYYVRTYGRNTIAHIYAELEMAGFKGEAADDVLDLAGVVADPDMVGSTLVHFAKVAP